MDIRSVGEKPGVFLLLSVSGRAVLYALAGCIKKNQDRADGGGRCRKADRLALITLCALGSSFATYVRSFLLSMWQQNQSFWVT